ncbi:MAG: restriction endonuclease subunit S [Candidatus Thiodiazotropha taylori]|nr:restriction endonuclease subunit S [Candidatus Thiodiazotropha taylori]
MIRAQTFADKWPVANLGQAVDFLDHRRKPVKASERVEGDYCYYGANGIQGTINDYLFDEPLVLLAEDGGHFGNPERTIAYIAEGKYWVNNHAHVLKPKDGIDLNYLCRVLEKYDVTPFIKGATRAKLSKTDASRIPIPLPPLPIQKQIAALLEKADTLRSQSKQMEQELNQLAQSMFLEMFGDPVTNPKEWDTFPVDRVTDCIVPGRDKPKSFSGGTPWVTTNLLRDKEALSFSHSEMGLSDSEINEVKARVIPEQSVLMTCVGELGVTSINKEKIVINQQLHSYQCNSEILPEFLCFLLPYKKNHMFKVATKTTVPYMNKAACNSIPIYLPPIELQATFAERYNTIMSRIANVRKKQVIHNELFSSLMQSAFSGKLDLTKAA